MKRTLLTLATLFALAATGFGQADPSAASRINYGTALPAACDHTAGEVFIKVGVAPTEFYWCSAADAWTKLGTPGVPPSSAGVIPYSDGSAWQNSPLNRVDANTVEQRNGANAQALRVYNTRADASNYERGIFQWNSDVLEVGADNAGTGTFRTFRLFGATLSFRTGASYAGATTKWVMDASGNLLTNVDGGGNIGASSSGRPATGHFTTQVIAPNFTGNLTGNVTGNVSGNAGTATRLFAIPLACGGNLFSKGIDAFGNPTCQQPGDVSGNAATATALAANGSNCSAGQYPLGVDASGNAEGCAAPSADIKNLSSTSVLSSSFTITAAAGTYQSTGLTVALPSAGVYQVSANVRAQLEISAGSNASVVCKFVNSTDAVDLTDSERMITFVNVTGVLTSQAGPMQTTYTAAGAKTIALQCKREGTTFTTSLVASSTAGGRTSLSYLKVSN